MMLHVKNGTQQNKNTPETASNPTISKKKLKKTFKWGAGAKFIHF